MQRRGRGDGKQKHMSKTNDGYFPITSVHRSDLEGLGYDVSEVDDGIMSHLASKMANAYLDQAFWIDLPILADHFGIPKKE
jgi:hypothetical protein